MDTETLKKWKQYTKEIEEQNKPIYEMWEKWNKNSFETYKKREAAAEKQYDAKNKSFQKRLEVQNKWDDLPFYKKLFRVPPPEIMPWDYPNRRYYPLPMMSFPLGLRSPRWEDFLDWLTEEGGKR